MQTGTIKQYLYLEYQDDPNLQAFVDAFNEQAQGYVDWFNQINLPIYTGLSGSMLDWIGAGIYGVPRPTIGAVAGAVYNFAVYDVEVYGAGDVSVLTASDDIYKRILTWKLYKGDGFNMSLNWLKRRIKRFLIGVNGTSPDIGSTDEISIPYIIEGIIEVVIDYPSDPASITALSQFLAVGVLDIPFQYNITVRSA